MNKFQLNGYITDAKSSVATKGMDYNIVNEAVGAYPFWDSEASEAKPSIVRVFEMDDGSGKKRHNVALAYVGPDEFYVWCGDSYIEGGACKPPAEDRTTMAAADMPDPVLGAKVLAELRSTLPKSTGCAFWQNFKSKGVLCKHCNQMLVQKEYSLPNILQELQETFEQRIDGKTTVGPTVAVSDEMFARLVMKVPVLLEGDKGWGKTREARMFADSIGAPLIVVAGHESVEAGDLLGYTVRHGDQWVWKDGRLAQAYRMAQSGRKVVLLIDEMLRIPQRQLSVLYTALAPHDDHYYLETGRIVNVVDGIGSEETLAAPVENLFIIGTTNVGAQYAVDAIDPALEDRMMAIRRHADVDKLREAVLSMATSKGFSAKVADQCVAFYEAMCMLKVQGFVKDTPNPRTLVRAIKICDSEKELPAMVEATALTWVTRDVDGRPTEDQVDAVLKAIKKVWP